MNNIKYYITNLCDDYNIISNNEFKQDYYCYNDIEEILDKAIEEVKNRIFYDFLGKMKYLYNIDKECFDSCIRILYDNEYNDKIAYLINSKWDKCKIRVIVNIMKRYDILFETIMNDDAGDEGDRIENCLINMINCLYNNIRS